MDTQIFLHPQEAAEKIAAVVAESIRKNPGRLVCFAAGDTPLAMLRALIALQEQGAVDLNTMYYAGLDEWVGLGYQDRGSCAQVMRDAFYIPAGIAPARIRVFDGMADPARACAEMDAWIEDRGKLFLTVLGVGMNGHIGFNEPYTPDTEGCLLVTLDETTRTVGKKYFGKPCPATQGITIGWRTLLTAEEMIIMATGAHKSEIIRRAFFAEADAAIPASLMRTHERLTLALDADAATGIKNI